MRYLAIICALTLAIECDAGKRNKRIRSARTGACAGGQCRTFVEPHTTAPKPATPLKAGDVITIPDQFYKEPPIGAVLTRAFNADHWVYYTRRLPEGTFQFVGEYLGNNRVKLTKVHQYSPIIIPTNDRKGRPLPPIVVTPLSPTKTQQTTAVQPAQPYRSNTNVPPVPAPGPPPGWKSKVKVKESIVPGPHKPESTIFSGGFRVNEYPNTR